MMKPRVYIAHIYRDEEEIAVQAIVIGKYIPANLDGPEEWPHLECDYELTALEYEDVCAQVAAMSLEDER